MVIGDAFMKKKYLKLNIDDNHLSLGNLFRCIKEEAINKSSALQLELFCTLFNIDYINDTTVNNYCTGCRGINNEYKQIFINYQKQYKKNKDILLDTVVNIISIMEGNIYHFSSRDEKRCFINENAKLKKILVKLYNISKNDKEVSDKFSNDLNRCIGNHYLYDGLVQIFFFAILVKKQPIFISALKKEILENLLNDTNISASSLEEYLNLKFREGVNYNYSLKRLAMDNNPYACFELGMNEYNGYVKDYPRYDISYHYFETACSYGHPSACYMISQMYYKKLIGNYSKEDLEIAYRYLNKAMELGNIAALNTMGLLYLNGIHPCKQNVDTAIHYFEIASNYNFAYAYNNLGMIYEKKNDLKTAFNYYLKSASLNESWACNKVGEFYRLGIVVDKDDKKAFTYYQLAIEASSKNTCYYAYYNLAKYYYLNGCGNVVIAKDKDKAMEYLKIAGDKGIIEAFIDLLYIYSDMYLTSNDEQYLLLVKEYANKVEIHSKYNDELRVKIENKLREIAHHKHIDISIIHS